MLLSGDFVLKSKHIHMYDLFDEETEIITKAIVIRLEKIEFKREFLHMYLLKVHVWFFWLLFNFIAVVLLLTSMELGK